MNEGERREDVARLFDSVPGDTPESVRERARALAGQYLGGEGLPLAPGDAAGPYEIVEVLGTGGQAVVYKARHKHIGRLVALKVPRKAVAERLLREAKLAAGLEHAAIARVEDVCVEGPVPYMVMELCEGGSLEALLDGRAEPLPLERVRDIARSVLEALEFAHQRGVVHRDVKPANILFDKNGKPRVADFGIGTHAHAAELDHTLGASQATKLAGTPLFMAPEQEDPALRVGGSLDGRADLFAFGKVLFQLLTGASPRTIRPPSRLRAGLDARWDDLVFKLTEERPEKRLATARETLEHLESCFGSAPVPTVVPATIPSSEPSPGWPPVTVPPVKAVDPVSRARHHAKWVAGILTALLLLAGWFTFSAGYVYRSKDQKIIELVGGSLGLAGLATAMLGVVAARAARPSGVAVFLGSHGFAGLFTGGLVAYDVLERLPAADDYLSGKLLVILLYVAAPLGFAGMALTGWALRALRPPELMPPTPVDQDLFPGARFRATSTATLLAVVLFLAAWFVFAWTIVSHRPSLEERSLARHIAAAGVLSGLVTMGFGRRANGAFRPRTWAVVLGSLGSTAFLVGSTLNYFLLRESPWRSNDRLEVLFFGVVPLVAIGLGVSALSFRLLRRRDPDETLEADEVAELAPVAARPIAAAPVARSVIGAILLALGSVVSAGLAYLSLVLAILLAALATLCLVPLQLLGGNHPRVHVTPFAHGAGSFTILIVGLASFALFLAFLAIRSLFRALTNRSAGPRVG